MKYISIIALSCGLLCSNAFAQEVQTQASQILTGQTMLRSQEADKNAIEGNAFLIANKNKKGVVALPDGLQYKIIKQGTGAVPTDTDTVTVNYAGTFIDGGEFDSSYKRGTPATFPVTGVIPGWTEALKLMKVGSTWELYIPANLAYGEDGASPLIGPDKTLIFKVELLGINK